MKQIKHIGAYGIIIKDNKILLINKNGGPYDGKLDLPGGTIEFNEEISAALMRELKEEVGIDIIDYELFDVISSNIEWLHKGQLEQIKHFAILYKINSFKNDIKSNIEITEINDDSKAASFYNIELLDKENLSNVAQLTLEKIKERK